MIREVAFLAEAHDDLEAAVAWYDEQEPGLGERLTLAVRDTLNAVASSPACSRPCPDRTGGRS